MIPRKKCIDFLLGIPANGRGQANGFLQWDNGENITIRGNACHYNYMGQSFGLVTAGASIVARPERQPVIQAFWDWTSGENSPWRVLFENGLEVVKDSDGIFKGWVMTSPGIQKVPFNLHKNFAIVCRSLTEHSARWDLWHHLVTEKKINPVDAWYFISIFMPLDNTKFQGVSKSELRQGGHWGLSDSSCGMAIYNGNASLTKFDAIFSFKRAMTGDINLMPMPQINGFFCDKIENYKGFDLKNLKMKTNGGRFSVLNFYDTTEALDEFYKWKSENAKEDQSFSS